MNLIRCPYGHYYDADTYATCPYCQGAQAASTDSETVAFVAEDVPDVTSAAPVNTEEAAPAAPFTAPADEGKTISYYDQKISAPMAAEPVVGWLVCISGNYFGQAFPLKSGRNFVGRSDGMDVCLKGEVTVSRDRQAVITYEPHERIFLAEPGDSRELFYINNDVVLDSVEIKPYDILSLGKVDLVMVPFCTKDFAWEDLEKDKDKTE